MGYKCVRLSLQEKSVNVYLTVLPAGSHDDTRWLSLNE